MNRDPEFIYLAIIFFIVMASTAALVAIAAGVFF